MALLVNRFIDRDSGFSMTSWAALCDHCRTPGPTNAGAPSDGWNPLPPGWRHSYRGSLLIATCPTCAPSTKPGGEG